MFIAEAYWDLECALQQQGFDYCYDKRLYDRLMTGDTPRRCAATCRADPAYQQPDSSGSSRTTTSPGLPSLLDPAQHRAAAVATLTQCRRAARPRRARPRAGGRHLPVFLGRFPDEPADLELDAFYRRLLAVLADPTFRTGEWQPVPDAGLAGTIATAAQIVVVVLDRRLALAGRRQPGRGVAPRRTWPRPWATLRGRAVAPARPDPGGVLRAGRRRPHDGLYVELAGLGMAPVPRERGTSESLGAADRHQDREKSVMTRSPTPPSTAGWPRPPGGPRTTCSTRTPGTSGVPTCPSGPGAPSARTTATDGDAWASFPHDHARSRAYRWNEDGMAGISDIRHELCLALALWNGPDPILKERMFGLTGPQGNHGEDVKEYWWYLEALPSHAWLRWRYHYPQAAFPYQRLVEENGAAGSGRPRVRAAGHRRLRRGPLLVGRRHLREGVAHRHARPRSRIENHGPDEATLSRAADAVVPQHLALVRATTTAVAVAGRGRDRGRPPAAGRVPPGRGAGRRRRPAAGAVLRQRDEHAAAVRRRRRSRAYPKDGINDHVVSGADTVNPSQQRHEGGAGGTGSRCPAGGRPSCGSGCTARPCRQPPDGAALATTRQLRRRAWPPRRGEADEFYAALAPADLDERADAGPPAGLRRAWSGASRCTRTG